MADVFTVLAADHADVKVMLAELETGPTRATGANQGQLDLRRESKEKSARIANAAAATSRGQVGRKGGKSGSYDDWSKQDLVRRAREIGIEGRSTMSRAQLIKALRDH